jgi:hypothetical protein
MHSFNAILAASVFISIVSGFPTQPPPTCRSTPAGNESQTPLSQPSGTTTAIGCQAECKNKNSCLSFVFGMVKNLDKCMLYSVATASVPKQSSTDLIFYDKACTSVPAVIPTQSNPTGANPKLAVRFTCGSAPAGTVTQKAPSPSYQASPPQQLCQEKCEANTSCLSFLFGMVSNADECMLYSVAASSIPTQTSANLVAYDKACTSVPSVVPTISNPQGLAFSSKSAITGSTPSTGSTGSTNQGSTAAQSQHNVRRNTCGGAPRGPSNNASPIAALSISTVSLPAKLNFRLILHANRKQPHTPFSFQP